MNSDICRSKYKGTLLGSLMGDCLGAPFEGKEILKNDKIVIQTEIDKMQDPKSRSPLKDFTDDTAMTKSVAKSLYEKPEPDMKYLAQLFTEEYFKEPNRGYGRGIVTVFQKLKKSNYENIFQPAKEQFNGSGSYGNGGAMRIAPVALFFHDDYENMVQVATRVTKITHSHGLAIQGALLQCFAIQEAFLTSPNEPINCKDFCNKLIKKLKEVKIENSEETNLNRDPHRDPYQSTIFLEKLDQIKILLNHDHSQDLDEDVIDSLGNGLGADESVPTALYCFLRAQSEIPEVDTQNYIRRTIQYAITLGGDTDTIASMAGAIAGAYLGEEALNKAILEHCEGYESIVDIADHLFNAKFNSH